MSSCSAPMGDRDLAALAAAVCVEARRTIEEGATPSFPEEAVQSLMTAAVKLFAAKVEAEERFFSPFLEGSVTATDVVVAASEMLRAVNLSTFDLAMWFAKSRPR